MDLAESITVLVAGELPGRMTDRSMAVPPLGQSSIDVIFIGVHNSTYGDRGANQGSDRDLFHVLQHPNHHRPGALNHSKDRRLFLRQRPTPALPPQPSPSGRPPFFFTAS